MREEYKTKQQGKDYVLFAGLVAEAHAKYLGFELTAVLDKQLFEKDPARPLVEAHFRGDYLGEDGELHTITATGIGTAGRDKDTRGAAADAPIEMAETRAKARALRVAVNVGETAFEELSGESGQPSTQDARVEAAELYAQYQRANPPRRQSEAAPEDVAEAAPEEEYAPITKKTRQQIELLAAELADLRGEDIDTHMGALEAEIGEKLEETTEDEGQKWLGRYKRAISKAKKDSGS